MIIQKLIVITILGFTLNITAQAGMTIKDSNGSIEQVQIPLLGLQMKATTLGFAKNQYDLGMAYYEGKIVKRDPPKAAEWLLKAGKKNYAPAMFVLGKMLLTGDGVEKNLQLGNQLITSAAEKGDKQALAFIEESRLVKNPQPTNQINGMCSYQDFYIQSIGDQLYAKKKGLKVEDIEERVKGPCSIKIIYAQNSIVEIYATLYSQKENYNAYITTKLNQSCNDEQCAISMNANKNDMIEYDRIVQYDNKQNEILLDQDYDEKYLKEKIKNNQSYCFNAMWAHSGQSFCLNLGGNNVYQNESIL